MALRPYRVGPSGLLAALLVFNQACALSEPLISPQPPGGAQATAVIGLMEDIRRLVSPLPRGAVILVPDFEEQFSLSAGGQDLGSPPSNIQPTDKARDLRDYIEALLIKSGRLIVERRSLRHARAELQFQHGGLADDNRTVRLGRMYGATHLLLGTRKVSGDLALPPENNLIDELIVRLVDLEKMVVVGVAVADLSPY